MVIVLPTASFAPDSSHALQSLRLPGEGRPDHDDQAGVGVDDDLVVRGVVVVLQLLGGRVVAGGHQSAVHDEHGVYAEPLARLECEFRAEVVDDPVGRELRDAEEWGELTQRQVRAPVSRDQQNPVFQRQAPRPTAPQLVYDLAADPRSSTCRSSAGSVW
ncbi:hypothetical protein GCM10010231_29420 [Streptomyces sindenensis]|nr:hypothetical protein GCM10010231_29420 [Streptomyces sindenensis]